MRLVVIAALGLALGCARPPAPAFFPETGAVPGWSKTRETRTFEAANLWQYVDGDADRYVQAGVQRTLTQDYRYQEKTEAVADVHVMAAPEGARKIFEAEPADESRPVQLGEAGRLYGQSLTFRKGRHFVRLVAYQSAPGLEKALVELARAIEGKL